MEFKSKRLLYKEFSTEDYNKFSSIFSNKQIMEYAYMDRITDEKEMLSYFHHVTGEQHALRRDSYELAVSLATDGSFVGVAVILLHYHMNRVKDGEIGYFLLPQFWGSGFASEIAQTLAGVCFNDLKLHKVVASCNANNARSEKIMKKIGMKREAVLRKERYKNGRWEDELRYAVLVEEWENSMLTVIGENPDSPEALLLMSELSDSLEALTGNSGKASFDPRDVRVPRSLFAVARSRTGEAVGCGAIRPLDENAAEVKRMYAKTKGTGIGTAVLAFLETEAAKLGYSKLCLETRRVNEAAVAFYEGRGYRRIPNYGKYAGRPEAVCFEKSLQINS